MALTAPDENICSPKLWKPNSFGMQSLQGNKLIPSFSPVNEGIGHRA